MDQPEDQLILVFNLEFLPLGIADEIGDQVRLMVTYAYDDLIVRDDTDRHRIERDVMILVLQRDTCRFADVRPYRLYRSRMIRVR